MKMRQFVPWLALLMLLVGLTACGSAATATPTVKPTVLATATFVPPTVPPAPTLPPAPTVAPTATPIPATPTATPIPAKITTNQLVNLRQGPGTNFSTAGQIPSKTTAVVLGKNEDGKWLQIAYPDASHPSWVSIAFVTVTGKIDTLPVIAVPVPPTSTPGAATPTKVALAATPTRSFPAAKGIMAFISYDVNQTSYVLKNLIVSPLSTSDAYLLGPSPVDLRNVTRTNAPPYAYSPDGSRVAYVYGPNGLTDVLRVTDSAGTPKDLVGHGAQTAAGGISSPVWTPDGTMIAYIGLDNNYNAQAIYTINANGGTENRFFTPRGNESFRGLAWGKNWILFVSNLTGAHEIWRLNSDGSGPLQLTADKTEDGSPAWSPDGKTFAYYSKRADGSYQIMVRNADGSNPQQLTKTGNNWSPIWSPDGNWIAFTSSRGGRLDVYIMDKNGGNVQLLTDKFPTESQLPGSWR